MEYEKRKQAKPSDQSSVPAPGPIVKAFSQMGEQERSRLKAKFDIAYFVVIEKLPFKRYVIVNLCME